MPDDLVLNVRQIGQYPRRIAPAPSDALLIQVGGVGGPYNFITPPDLVSQALLLGGNFQLAPGSGVAWNGALLSWNSGQFSFSEPVTVPSLNALTGMTIASLPVATQAYVASQIDAAVTALENAGIVNTFDGRTGNIFLTLSDITFAGGAPIDSPFFVGNPRAPTPWNSRVKDSTVATTEFVWNVINDLLCNQILVFSFNGRGGHITLTTNDVNNAYFTSDYGIPRAPNPAPGDSSNRIATTAWVSDKAAEIIGDFVTSEQFQQLIDNITANFAPLASPNFTGNPTAPTPSPGDNTGSLATTAFVTHAVTAATAGVASFNTRTGAVTLTASDVIAAGGAPINTPTFTGTPSAPTAVAATNTTQIATTAFVHSVVTAVSAGVTSFNTRTGAVVLTTADVTGVGAAPVASPAFTGTPTAPTAVAGTATDQIATTHFVQSAITAITTSDVTSFNGRIGAVTLLANDVSAVGGALLNSPSFTGVPAAPTAPPGTNTNQLATCAFVTAMTSGVSSFNGRTGVVTLTTGDITGAGGAPIASPALTGTPTAPTALQSVNDTTIATTAYVRAAVSAATSGVVSWNGRTGTITMTAADVTGVGGALLGSPAFTGLPTAPTASPGTSTTQVATTAFVQAAISGSVTTFNGRSGAVALNASDITGVGGALLASPSLTGTPTAPTPTAGTNNTQIATCAFVNAAISAGPFVLTTGNQNLTGGFTETSFPGGLITGASPTYTPAPANGNFQHITLNGSALTGSFTFAPPPIACTQIITEITNSGSGAVAATLTTSGYTKTDGSWTSANGNKFLFISTRSQNYSHLQIVPLQ